MRFVLFAAAFVLLPLAAHAVDAPPGQARIDGSKALRGRFVEMHQTDPAKPPLESAGHFVVAPARGLIWGMETPLPTATVVTREAAVQNLGGLMVKLPAKNLKQLYNMVGGALAGDWSLLEQDYVIARNGNAGHWQMTLTPRRDKPSPLAYTVITVSGARFVEDIVLTRGDGRSDSFSFSDESLSAADLTPQENALFAKAGAP